MILFFLSVRQKKANKNDQQQKKYIILHYLNFQGQVKKIKVEAHFGDFIQKHLKRKLHFGLCESV